MGKVIDYGSSEKIMLEIESIFKDNEMDREEILLVLKFLMDRQMQLKQKEKMKDMIGGMPMGLGKLFGKGEE